LRQPWTLISRDADCLFLASANVVFHHFDIDTLRFRAHALPWMWILFLAANYRRILALGT
jgi:hypothetical protein